MAGAGSFYGSPLTVADKRNVSLSGLRDLQTEVYRQGLAGGHDQQIGSTGQVAQTPEVRVIYGLIREPELTASPGDLPPSFSPEDAGFIAPDGYKAYAFDEINPAWPWRGEKLVEGVSTTLPVDNVGGGNFAYPLNDGTVKEGTKVRLRRAGEHWEFDPPAEPISACDDGRIYTDCDGDGIAESCWELKIDATGKPYYGPCGSTPGGTDGQLTPKQCYEKCIAEGGTEEHCRLMCGLLEEGDPLPPVGQVDSGGGGGGGFGGGGFGGGP